MPQIQQRLGAVEGLLGRPEALRDDRGLVVVHDELLGVHHRREALHALRLGRIGGHVEDVRHRGDGVRPFHVQAGLQGPGVAVLQAGAVAARRRRLHLGLPVPVHVLEGGRSGAARLARLAAHVRQAHLGVEVGQVRGHVRVAERVDDGDRDALPLMFAVRRTAGAGYRSSASRPG